MKLTNCPHCKSGEVEMYGVYATLKDKDINGHCVYCESCGSRGPVKKTRRGAENAWNKLDREFKQLQDEIESRKDLLECVIRGRNWDSKPSSVRKVSVLEERGPTITSSDTKAWIDLRREE